MNTNEKGAIGVASTIKALTEQGWDVFVPLDGHGPIDLVAIRGTVNCRLQVKYRKLNPNGSVDIPLNTVVNGKKVRMNTDLIDGWSLYIPERDAVLFVDKYLHGALERKQTFRISGELVESGLLRSVANREVTA